MKYAASPPDFSIELGELDPPITYERSRRTPSAGRLDRRLPGESRNAARRAQCETGRHPGCIAGRTAGAGGAAGENLRRHRSGDRSRNGELGTPDVSRLLS